MALINCPHCNREISEKAPVCPGCGCALREPVPATPKPEIVTSPKGGDHEAPCPDCGKLNWSKPQIKSFSLRAAIDGICIGFFIAWIIHFFYSAEWVAWTAIAIGFGRGFKIGKNIIEITCLSCGKVVHKN